MDRFLEKVAKHIAESGIELGKWVIILPSERATHYLQSALEQLLISKYKDLDYLPFFLR